MFYNPSIVTLLTRVKSVQCKRIVFNSSVNISGSTLRGLFNEYKLL